jgi:hypothetical protein
MAWLVETDHRRGSIGLQVSAGRDGANHATTALWLEPAQAELVAQQLLGAVQRWREDQASTAWATSPKGGAR